MPSAPAPRTISTQRAVTVNKTAWSWAQAGIILSALLVVASLFYPVLATGPRLAQRFDNHPTPLTLNALDWMRYGTLSVSSSAGREEIQFQDDLAAINWFNENIEGSPVIAEASIGPYRGNGSRFSIATGLPSILGWARHEYQQRYPEDITRRDQDVRTLYNTASVKEKLNILDRYNVAYVIVGDVERLWAVNGDRYASEAGMAAFNEMVGNSLEVAFQQGSTTVYRVIQDERQ
jgi:uncharacterized membrane protein